MKTILLSFIILLFSFSTLRAQCIVENDTTSIPCGGSVQLNLNINTSNLSYPSSNSLNQIIFADQMVGYIAGDQGTLMKTTDGGINWTVDTYLSNQDWISVSFLNQQAGVIASKNGTIARTVDGGLNWNVVFDDNTIHFTRITFISSNLMIAIGYNGMILRSADGGITWNAISSGTSAELNDIRFVNDTKGFIGGDYDFNQFVSVFLVTSDGGNTWVNTASSIDYCEFLNIEFINENVGYVTGYNNAYKTVDGGVNWSKISWLGYNIALLDDSTGYGASVTEVQKFSHSGHQIQYNLYNMPGQINDIACPDSGRVFIIGNSGFLCSSFLPVSYHWVPSEGLSADNILSPVASPMEPTTYELTVQLSDGTTCTGFAYVSIHQGWYWPDICLITVDAASGHFRIQWDKPTLSTADSVYLYKDGPIAGQPIRLAGFSASAPGEFLDEQSNPVVNTEWYNLCVVDKCSLPYTGSGNSPVHLAINKGFGNTWNLIWSEYFGAEKLTYKIYRGTMANNLQLLTSVSPGITQFTDISAPAGDVWYQIETVLNVDCNLPKSVTSSYSNLASNIPFGTEEDQLKLDFRILNNPVIDNFCIAGLKIQQIATIRLLTPKGEIINTWYNPDNSTFDISGIAKGLYLLKIELKETHRCVIQKLIKI